MTDWSEAMSVGHRGVDDQHRGLVERVKALNAALCEAVPGDAVSVAAPYFQQESALGFLECRKSLLDRNFTEGHEIRIYFALKTSSPPATSPLMV